MRNKKICNSYLLIHLMALFCDLSDTFLTFLEFGEQGSPGGYLVKVERVCIK
jgi:hypothetical protein